MAIDSEEFLHLARPIAPTLPGFNTNISPLTVNLQTQVCLEMSYDVYLLLDFLPPPDLSL